MVVSTVSEREIGVTLEEGESSHYCTTLVPVSTIYSWSFWVAYEAGEIRMGYRFLFRFFALTRMSHSSPGFTAKPDNTRGMKELCVINVASYDWRDPGYILG